MSLEAVMSGRDAMLVAVPLIVALLFCVFQLDTLLFHSNAKGKPVRPARRGLDDAGREIFNDPDGRPNHLT